MSSHLTWCLIILVLLAFPIDGGTETQVDPPFLPVVVTPNESLGGELSCYVLGGWSKNGWVDQKEASDLIQGGETYHFYNLTGKVGEAPGSRPLLLGEPCPETPAVNFTAAPISKRGMVALGGQVTALPRTPKLLSTSNKVYREAAAAILRQKGILRPNVRLTQVIRVDLDGDGTEEVVVSATHYVQGLSARANPGDYSLVFLKKVVQGKVATIILEGDYFPQGVKFGAPGEHQIGAILDLNGDGVMEIILFGRYYEGEWVAAYWLDKGDVKKLFSAGCGA